MLSSSQGLSTLTCYLLSSSSGSLLEKHRGPTYADHQTSFRHSYLAVPYRAHLGSCPPVKVCQNLPATFCLCHLAHSWRSTGYLPMQITRQATGIHTLPCSCCHCNTSRGPWARAARYAYLFPSEFTTRSMRSSFCSFLELWYYEKQRERRESLTATIYHRQLTDARQNPRTKCKTVLSN